MLRTGSVCGSLLYNYLKNSTADTEGDDYDIAKKSQTLKVLTNTFENAGGALSKISQILSFDDPGSKVFSECKPFSPEETQTYLKNMYNTNEKFRAYLKSIDFEIYRSGSVGQVHRAVSVDDANVVIKVQYDGIDKQARADLGILEMISKVFYSVFDLKNALVDIKTKLEEELDYNLERQNHQILYDLWKDSAFVEIPELVPELCTDKTLGMHFVEGRGLNQFLNEATQEEKNTVGGRIMRFVFENLYKHKILYSDIHYGNFLVKDDLTLCVLDFGCVHTLDDDLHKNICILHKSLMEDDKTMLYNTVTNIGIISDATPQESVDYLYKYFTIQFTPLTTPEFTFTQEWLHTCNYKDAALMKHWTLPLDMVYFNKLPYGLYHILMHLDATGSFSTHMKELLYEN